MNAGELPRPLARALAWLQAQQAGPRWLVGGALRNRLLGKPVKDLDLVLAASPLDLGAALAKATGGHWVPLDEARAIGRILWRTPASRGAAAEAEPTLDLARLAGEDLAADLVLRDFTVNTLALDLDGAGPEAFAAGGEALAAAISDPLGGLEDLRDRSLRMVAPANLAADPVRLLRAVRLAAELGLTVEEATAAAIRRLAPRLGEAPPERLRAEWLRALALPAAVRAIDLAEDLGLLDAFLPRLAEARHCPQSPPHDRDVHRHSLDAARGLAWILARLLDPPGAAGEMPGGVSLAAAFDAALEAEGPRLRDHLQGAPVWDEQPRRGWLVLAALLHDLGKPVTARWEEGAEGARLARELARGLRAAGPAADFLEAVVASHMLPLWLSTGPPVDDRALHRYFRATGRNGVDVALLALADNSAKGPLDPAAADRLAQAFRQICRTWFEERGRLVDVALPLDGRDLMEALGLPPGPQLGHLLDGLREAVAAGELAAADRPAALAWARRRL